MTAPSPATVTPTFVFSLPRSGSTLLQRMLAAHSAISTSAEPWLLLPLLSATQSDGVYSAFSHQLSARAIRDLCTQLPGGKSEYDAELRQFVQRLYQKLSAEDAQYFLDKTPRYSLVVDDVLDLFPDSPMLLLWRNPLSVIASSVTSWSDGRWAPHVLKVDLFDGLTTLVDAYARRPERFEVIRYESLVTDPVATTSRVLEHLGLAWEAAVVDDFDDTRLHGAMGDKRGVRSYDTVSAAPLHGWKRTLCSPVRKAWCRRYLRWLGAERLAIMGYDLTELLRELDAVPTRLATTMDDAVRTVRGAVWSVTEPAIVRRKLARLPDFGRIYSHS